MIPKLVQRLDPYALDPSLEAMAYPSRARGRPSCVGRPVPAAVVVPVVRSRGPRSPRDATPVSGEEKFGDVYQWLSIRIVELIIYPIV